MILLFACTAWQKPASGFKGATGGEQLERALWDEIKARRWKELRNHLSPTFVMTTATGALDRDQALAYWEQLRPSDYSLAELQVHPNGQDAVVTYVLTLQQASSASQVFRVMTVWQQLGARWVAIAHSQLPAPAPPATP